MNEKIFVKEQSNKIYIRAIGHITANSCSKLKTRVFDRLEAKPPVENVFFDLSLCDYMDSTFMGLIVGINKKFMRFSEISLTIYGLNETCTKLLKTVGIIKLVNICDKKPEFPEEMDELEVENKAGLNLVLTAHEDLIELSEENKRRFAALKEALSDAQKNQR